MSIKHNRKLTELAFEIWIRNYPESFHPLDMKRFYVFVKTVCYYSRKAKGGEWLREKIEKSGSKLSEEDIEFYCDKFIELKEFHKVHAMPIYDIRG